MLSVDGAGGWGGGWGGPSSPAVATSHLGFVRAILTRSVAAAPQAAAGGKPDKKTKSKKGDAGEARRTAADDLAALVEVLHVHVIFLAFPWFLFSSPLLTTSRSWWRCVFPGGGAFSSFV